MVTLWKTLKPKLEKKFAAGRTHIPALYPDLASGLEQIFVLYRRARSDKTINGVSIVAFEDFLNKMRDCLKGRDIHKAKIPEAFPLLRLLHHTVYYRPPSCASADAAATGRATTARGTAEQVER